MDKIKLQEVLDSLTLDEKIGQLIQLTANFFGDKATITGPMESLNITEDVIKNCGSILNICDKETFIDIQKKHLQSSKIPLMVMCDVINGLNVIYPIPLAISCSFNRELFYEFAYYSGLEAKANSIHVTFAPMLDLVRDPRWGRVLESFGEDPYLGSEFGKYVTRGFQKNIASCVKHFAGYGLVEAGKEYNHGNIGYRQLYDFYLRPYFEAIKECMLVMPSFNTIDEVPSTCNKRLLIDLLRNKLGFEGVIISDYTAIKELVNHNVANNYYEACVKAFNCSVDIDMMSSTYVNNIKKAIENGDITVDALDKEVYRILSLKNDLGLFENPYGCSVTINKDEIYESTKRVASESIILLKNENNILPLKNGKTLVVGPYIDDSDMCGSWSLFRDKSYSKNLKDILDDSFETISLNDFFGDYSLCQEKLNEILKKAKECDRIVAIVGESRFESGEAYSKTNIDLNYNHLNLVKEIYNVNKNIISVVVSGRPLVLTELEKYSKAILLCYMLGSSSATVIYETLKGINNPSAKLNMTLPRSLGQVPIYYNQMPTGRPYVEGSSDRYLNKYIDSSNLPLYEFGHGLSYSNFKYLSLELNKTEISLDESLKIEVTIENDSDIDGSEVVLLYISDVKASVSRPLKELKGFEKVFIKAHETKKVEFEITSNDLVFLDIDYKEVCEKGDFIVEVKTIKKLFTIK